MNGLVIASFFKPGGRWLITLLGLLPLLAMAQAPPVELATVERRDIVETLRLSASLSSPLSARLSPDVEGRLVQLEVDVGARVKAGDLLFRVDDELARLELAQAIAFEQEAQSELKNARRRAVEVRELVSKKTFPESEALTLEAQVERFEAILERRRAEHAYAAATLAHHSHRAPFSGVIAERNADLGERVDTDSNVLLLVETDLLQLDLRVPQQYFRRVAVGTPVRIGVDALPGQIIEASIARVVPVSDPQARTFIAQARIDNSAGLLAPGMSVSAQLRIGTAREAEVIPRDALIRYPDGRSTVWVVENIDERYSVQERLLKIGLSFDGVIEVLQGLDVGERVVVRGNESLRQGQQVSIRE
jgi:membrane fusion protein, multidrug efflux system